MKVNNLSVSYEVLKFRVGDLGPKVQIVIKSYFWNLLAPDSIANAIRELIEFCFLAILSLSILLVMW